MCKLYILCVAHVLSPDIYTYIYIYLKFLNLLCRCPCRVMCPCPCFLGNDWWSQRVHCLVVEVPILDHQNFNNCWRFINEKLCLYWLLCCLNHNAVHMRRRTCIHKPGSWLPFILLSRNTQEQIVLYPLMLIIILIFFLATSILKISPLVHASYSHC